MAKRNKDTGLTEKQELFCDEYLVDLNATKAAIRSGYSEKSARSAGAANMKNPYISEYIKKRMDEKKDSLIATQDEVLRFLTAVMRREQKEVAVVVLTDKKTSYKPDKTGKVRKVEETKETPTLVEYPSKISDANRAAELLGKRWGLWEKGQETDEETEGDGFMEALRGEAQDIWEEK